MQPLYSFQLMKDSGNISGYLVTPEQSERIDQALTALASMEEMEKKYGITDKGIFVYAVGDGNNSLATAKLHYDNLKRTLSEQKLQNHPARYTLAEIVNIHDDYFDFEPINRVLFGVDTLNFLQHLGRVHNISFTPQEGQQYFDLSLIHILFFQRLQPQIFAHHIDGSVLLKNLDDRDEAWIFLFSRQCLIQVHKRSPKIFKLRLAVWKRFNGTAVFAPSCHTKRKKLLNPNCIPNHAILRLIGDTLPVM